MAVLKTLTINDTGYIKLPSGTSNERPLSPSIGMVRYNSDLNCNEYYDGTQWIDVITGEPPIITNGLILNLDAGSPLSYSTSGTTWTDLSGNGNNGTLTNGIRYSTTNGGSLVFDGVDDKVSLIAGNDFAYGTGDFTVESWIYPTAFAALGKAIFSQSVSGTNYFLFSLGSSGEVSITMTLSGGGTPINGPSNVQLNRWSHVAVTRISGVVTVYVNTSPGTPTTNTTNLTNTTYVPTIGEYSHANQLPFSGNIANLRIYKGKGLTASEIVKNYDALKSRYIIPQTFNPINVPIVTNGLVTYLDAGITYSYPTFGTTWFDLVSTNNATLINGVTYEYDINNDSLGKLFFDGSNDYASLGSFFTYQTFTISVWVYPGSTQVAYADIFDNNHTGLRSFVLQQDNLNTNQYTFGVADSSGVISGLIITIPANSWTNITVSFSPTDRVRAYINGQFLTQGAAAGGRNIVYSSQSLLLGGWAAGGRHWNGRMSTFAIYNRLLSSSEVQQNFNAVRGRYQIQENSVPILTDGLALHLDAANPYSYSGTGSNWIDLSGNGRNFVWASTPSYTSSGNRSYFSTLNNRCTGPASNSFGITNTSGYTIFLIFEQNALTGASAFKFYKNNLASSPGRGIFAHAAWTDNNIYFDQGGCCDVDTRTAIDSGGTLTWNIFIFRRFTNSSTRTIGKNQNILTTNTAAAATLDLDTRAVDLGSSDEYGGNASLWNAKLNSFIVYNRGLTDEEVSQNVTLLSRRLGI